MRRSRLVSAKHTFALFRVLAEVIANGYMEVAINTYGFCTLIFNPLHTISLVERRRVWKL